MQPEFTTLAASFWKQKQGTTKRVNGTDLQWIAEQLDSRNFTPPSKYLEAKAAKSLKTSNSKNASSKSSGAIHLWSELVKRGDKDDIRAMRKLLSRYARKRP